MDSEIRLSQDQLLTGDHNYSMNSDENAPVNFPRYATLLAAAASILFIIIGITGNLVTIIALTRSVKLRVHATTAFVISLCISDLLFCTINMPLTASRYIHEEWVLGDVLCRLFPFFFYGNVAASLMNMVAITLNRYILIAHHSIYDRIYKQKNIVLMIICIWLFCFGMMTLPLIEVWGTLGLDPPTFSCTILKKNGTSPKKFLFLFGFLFPCIAIIICYSAIYYKVKQSRMKMNSHLSNRTGRSPFPSQTSSKTTQARKEDLRLTRMMLIIFLGFVFSFFPLMIVNVADDGVSVPLLHILASVLAWASAVINPFVYAVTNRQYREAYKKLFYSPAKQRAKQNNKITSSSRTYVTEFQYHASTGVLQSPSTITQNPILEAMPEEC